MWHQTLNALTVLAWPLLVKFNNSEQGAKSRKTRDARTHMCVAGQKASIEARGVGNSFGERNGAAPENAGCVHQYENWPGDRT